MAPVWETPNPGQHLGPHRCWISLCLESSTKLRKRMVRQRARANGKVPPSSRERSFWERGLAKAGIEPASIAPGWEVDVRCLHVLLFGSDWLSYASPPRINYLPCELWIAVESRDCSLHGTFFSVRPPALSVHFAEVLTVAPSV
jgi:hypothetical protein